MEWIIGLVIIYLIWRIFFARGSEEALVQRELADVYSKYPGEYIESKLIYERYRDYGLRRGGEESSMDGGGKSISFNVKVFSGETVYVLVMQNKRNNKATLLLIDVEKRQEYVSEIKAKYTN